MSQMLTEMEKCFAQLEPTVTNPLTSPSKNTYVTYKSKAASDSTCIEYILKTTKETQITQSVKKRINKLRFLPQHENIVPITAKGHNKLKKQVYILSQYFWGSQSIETTAQGKRNPKMGVLNCIIYQVIRGMRFLEENKVNHLRLNPSSILVKFDSNSENPVVRICDLGISVENRANYPHEYCLHANFFDPNRNIYSESYEECVKYDLWALGSIIYYCLKKKKPFFGKEGFFSDKMIFKSKHLLSSQAAEKWLAKNSNSISESFLLERFIAKCWGIKKKPVFKSWAEALQFYEETDYNATPSEKISIFEIYNNHVSLIFLLSKIYVLMREELQYEITKLTQGTNEEAQKKNRQNIDKLSLFIFKFAYLYHTSQFQTHFMNRCSVLPLGKRQLLVELQQYIQKEKQFLQNSFLISQKQYSFQYLIEKVDKRIVEFQMRYEQISRIKCTTPKIQLLVDFFRQFLKEIIEAKKVLQDPTRDRCELLNVLYESEALQKRAKSCGFKMPKFSLIRESQV